jgi:hypothetical protein
LREAGINFLSKEFDKPEKENNTGAVSMLKCNLYLKWAHVFGTHCEILWTLSNSWKLVFLANEASKMIEISFVGLSSPLLTQNLPQLNISCKPRDLLVALTDVVEQHSLALSEIEVCASL